MSKEEVRVIGGIGDEISNDGRQFYQQDRIYDKESLSPCLNGSCIIPNVIDTVLVRQATNDGVVPCKVGGWQI